jgi:hypothetical protein
MDGEVTHATIYAVVAAVAVTVRSVTHGPHAPNFSTGVGLFMTSNIVSKSVGCGTRWGLSRNARTPLSFPNTFASA